MANKNIDTTRVITGEGRLCFPHVFARDDSEMGGDKYNATILIPKADKKTVAKIRDAIEEAKDRGQQSKWNGTIPRKLWTPLRDGDEERDTDKYPEYAGCYYINAKSDRQPGVIGPDKQEIIDPEEIYSGCYAKVSISFYPYAASGSNGIGAALNNIMKTRDGDRLGGSVISAEDDFADEEVMDDDGLLD